MDTLTSTHPQPEQLLMKEVAGNPGHSSTQTETGAYTTSGSSAQEAIALEGQGGAAQGHADSADSADSADTAASDLDAAPAARTPGTGRLFEDEAPADDEEHEVVMASGPRRSAETEAAYAARVRQLYAAAAVRRGMAKSQAEAVSPGEVVQDLLELGPQRSLASWRLYRSALLWHLAQHRRHSPDHQAAYDWLVGTKMEPARREGAPRRVKNTIPERDLKILLNTLGANAVRSSSRQGANWAERTQYWLHAGLATGLRPNEWQHAHWADAQRLTLMAPNSKAKMAEPAFRRAGPGRSVYDDEPFEAAQTAPPPDATASAPTGQAPTSFRAIAVPEEARDWVSLHLNSIRDSGVDFALYYERCRQALWRACRTAFKGRVLYSLYTMRSQFSANAKATMPLEDVAELMGHTDPTHRTTQLNYGPRRAAHAGSGGLRDQNLSTQLEAHSDRPEGAAAPAMSDVGDLSGRG